MLTSSPRVSSVPIDSTAHVMGTTSRVAQPRPVKGDTTQRKPTRGSRASTGSSRRAQTRSSAARSRGPGAALGDPGAAGRDATHSATLPARSWRPSGESPSGWAPTVSGPSAPRAHGPRPEAPRGASANGAGVAPRIARGGVAADTAATIHSSSVGRRPPRAWRRRPPASARVMRARRARRVRRASPAAGAARCAHAPLASPRTRRCGTPPRGSCAARTRPSASQSDGPTAIVVSGTSTRTSGASHPAARARAARGTGAPPQTHRAPRRERSPAPQRAPSSLDRASATPDGDQRRPTVAASTSAAAIGAPSRSRRATRSASTPMPLDLDLERVARDERPDALGRPRRGSRRPARASSCGSRTRRASARRRSCAPSSRPAAGSPLTRQRTRDVARGSSSVSIHGPTRAERVEALRARELHVLALQIARGDVARARVAEDVRERVAPARRSSRACR